MKHCVLLLALTGCASLGRDDNKPDLTLTATSIDDFKPVEFQELNGLAEYKFGDAPEKVEWINCKTKAAVKASILVMHRDRAGFEDKKFCEGWIAQTFLSQGFDVVTVNRPGYGDSTGVNDFSGEQSMVAIEAGLKAAVEQGKNAKPVEGIWGYSTGVATAALFAKRAKSFKWLILGGGIYDYETTLAQTKDDYIRKDIEAIQKTGGAAAIEERSIGYDVSGLPKTIAIYHGMQDTSAPLGQAKSFNDALESSGEYKVTYQAIDGVTHEIPWTHHRKILEILAHSIGG